MLVKIIDQFRSVVFVNQFQTIHLFQLLYAGYFIYFCILNVNMYLIETICDTDKQKTTIQLYGIQLH